MVLSHVSYTLAERLVYRLSMSSSFLYSLAREIHNGTQGLSKDKSPTCKHLTVSVCQLMKEPIRSLSLQHTQLKLEANPTIPANGELEGGQGDGQPRGEGPPPLLEKDTHSTVTQEI